MEFDLRCLTSTPDIRCIPNFQARLVCALRYVHQSRQTKSYDPGKLADLLGSMDSVRHFHVFIDEVGHAWSEPIYLNCSCKPLLSYDEMLIIDLLMASGHDDRQNFDLLINDMVSERARNAVWCAASKFHRSASTQTPRT